MKKREMEVIARLASGVAHDFNNLLTINLGYASLLLSKDDLSEKTRRCIETMNDATKRAALLTKQLLAFSGQQNTHPIVLDAHQVITETKSLLARMAGESVDFQYDLSSRSANIKIDRTQLEQILISLVMNSLDAITNSGTISITTKLDDSRARLIICVKDNGHGMNPEVQEKIFEPFFTTKIGERGRGFGLATVYGIVQKCKGDVWVESTVGSGTSVFIAFPLESADKSKEANSKKTASIMVVDDESEVRQVVLDMLRNAGFEVFSAENAKDALTQLATKGRSVDLVLTDVIMPKTTGIELAESLGRVHPSLPIVFMSGHTRDTQFKNDVHSGQKRFLQKPFTNDTLLQALHDALND